MLEQRKLTMGRGVTLMAVFMFVVVGTAMAGPPPQDVPRQCGAGGREIDDVQKIYSEVDGSDVFITPNVPVGYNYKDGYGPNEPEYTFGGVGYWTLWEHPQDLGFHACGPEHSFPDNSAV